MSIIINSVGTTGQAIVTPNTPNAQFLGTIKTIGYTDSNTSANLWVNLPTPTDANTFIPLANVTNDIMIEWINKFK